MVDTIYGEMHIKLSEKMKEKTDAEDLGTDIKIILECILRK